MIPTALTSRVQWCTWKQSNGTKIPTQPNGFPMRSNDPATFVSYEVAKAASDKIAYIIQADDEITGIDLDNCLDEKGNLRPWAVPIATRLDGVAFAEISPSGKGIKFLTRATKKAGSKCVKKFGDDKQQMECYDFNRFWTITGDIYAGNDSIGNGQKVVDWLCETYLIEKKEAPAENRRATWKSATEIEDRARSYVENADLPGEGDRNNSLFRLAGHLIAMVGDDGSRLSISQVANFALQFNDRFFEPLPLKEVDRTVASAEKNGTPREAKPPQITVVDNSDVDLSKLGSSKANGIEIDKTVPIPEKLPSAWLRPPGLISDIIDYTLRCSIYPQPELALAGAIALMGTITGRKLADDTGNRTNVYVLGLAPSGAGKEQARKTNKLLLAYAGGEAMIGNERIGSSAGMVTSIVNSPAILFQIDEIGRFLETIKNPSKAPHLYNVATVLMSIYGCSDTIWIGDAYADAKKVPKVNQPHPCLYGTSVPEKFWESLTSENVTDGLLGRMLPFESSEGYVDPQQPELLEPPSELIDQVRFWVDLKMGGNLYEQNPVPVTAKYTAEASDRFRNHMMEIARRRQQEDKGSAALWSRSAGRAGKLALIFAASRCPMSAAFCVEIEDVNRAIAISNWLTRTVQRKVFEHVSENETESATKRVLRILKQEPMTKSSLTRKTQWLRRRERNEILETLIESKLIEVVDDPTAERGRVVFKALC